MNDDPKENSASGGRLRAEDRRGSSQEPLFGVSVDDLLSESRALEETWAEKESERRSVSILRVICGVVLAGAGALVWWVFQSSPSEVARSASRVGKTAPLFIERATAKEVEKAVQEVVVHYMNAKNNGLRCEVIHGGEEMLSVLREYEDRAETVFPEGFGGRIKMEPYALQGSAAMSVLASDLDPRKLWVFIVSSTVDGMKIDWKASVAYGEMSWPDLMTQRPQKPVQMRVYLQDLPVAVEPEIDERTTRAFAVSAKGYELEERILVKRDSPIGIRLGQLVPPGARQPVNVRLGWSGQALQLVEVIHNYWMQPQEF
jgi:hypothetical protein